MYLISMASGSQEFQVFRMQQFDMPFGNRLGSQSNQIKMEARTIDAKPAALSRRCVLVKLKDFTLERYRYLVSQYVGAIIALLPTKFDQDDKLVMFDFIYLLLDNLISAGILFDR
jgi:hypothetical protein